MATKLVRIRFAEIVLRRRANQAFQRFIAPAYERFLVEQRKLFVASLRLRQYEVDELEDDCGDAASIMFVSKSSDDE